MWNGLWKDTLTLRHKLISPVCVLDHYSTFGSWHILPELPVNLWCNWSQSWCPCHQFKNFLSCVILVSLKIFRFTFFFNHRCNVACGLLVFSSEILWSSIWFTLMLVSKFKILWSCYLSYFCRLIPRKYLRSPYFLRQCLIGWMRVLDTLIMIRWLLYFYYLNVLLTLPPFCYQPYLCCCKSYELFMHPIYHYVKTFRIEKIICRSSYAYFQYPKFWCQ